jgi:hypothetical protein
VDTKQTEGLMQEDCLQGFIGNPLDETGARLQGVLMHL